MVNRFIWKYFVRHLARSQDFVDPLVLLSRWGRFAQPSEVLAPVELLRATVVLHVRGLLNAQAIQHNLDWIWPYWVHQQFDPRSISFIPRAFSLTHINLTHRNWTAIGLPDVDETPLVDPRGLVTPLWDGWSLDTWIINKNGRNLIPSKLQVVQQRMDFTNDVRIITDCQYEHLQLKSEVEMVRVKEIPTCRILVHAKGGEGSKLVISVRPYNPEGISLIKTIGVQDNGLRWKINQSHEVNFNVQPVSYVLSDYRKGDVYSQLDKKDNKQFIECSVEMASGAAVFDLQSNELKTVTIDVPLKEDNSTLSDASSPAQGWKEALDGCCKVSIPEKLFQNLFDIALRTLIIHTATDVYAGPYVYKRFWFRDAVFITYALLCCGFHSRAERIIDHFSRRQKINGLFESQEGEWDANGQVLWVIEKFCKMTGKPPKPEWKKMILNGGRWIIKKRLPDTKTESLHSGLMPSGFSAEHLGPNDYYYWDDFWSVAGLNGASYLTQALEDNKASIVFFQEANKLQVCIERSLLRVSESIKALAMPSSPYRRLDSAAVGSLVCGYPLDLWKEKDRRLIETVEYLLKNCLVNDGFFHDMSHSGINPYLTLHIAQVLLRAGDLRYFRLMHGIASLASSTGQWPEAIHPQTRGGCMGDGQHVWAAAEWLMMIRNCFVREEERGDRLILCSGLPLTWFKEPVDISFGPVWTIYGKIDLKISNDKNSVHVSWQVDWHNKYPNIEIHFLGQEPVYVKGSERKITINLP